VHGAQCAPQTVCGARAAVSQRPTVTLRAHVAHSARTGRTKTLEQKQSSQNTVKRAPRRRPLGQAQMNGALSSPLLSSGRPRCRVSRINFDRRPQSAGGQRARVSLQLPGSREGCLPSGLNSLRLGDDMRSFCARSEPEVALWQPEGPRVARQVATKRRKKYCPPVARGHSPRALLDTGHCWRLVGASGELSASSGSLLEPRV